MCGCALSDDGSLLALALLDGALFVHGASRGGAATRRAPPPPPSALPPSAVASLPFKPAALWRVTLPVERAVGLDSYEPEPEPEPELEHEPEPELEHEPQP